MSNGFKQSRVGVIPEDWEVVSLGAIGESLIGLTFSQHEVSDTGVLVLRSSNIQAGGLSFEDNVWVQAVVPDKLMIRPGDVLICARNGSRELIGKSVLISREMPATTFGAFMAVHRGVDGHFVSHQMRSEIVRRQIHDHLGATINQITNRSLNSFAIPYPPTMEERNAIAGSLSDADALVESLDALIAKKRDMKQAAMQQLVTGHTRLPGFSEEWRECKIGDFTDCKAGGTPSTGVPEFWGGSIRWMSSGELNFRRVSEVSGRITDLGLANSSAQMFPPMSVLIGLAGQGRTRGTSAINLVPLSTNQSIAAIFPSNEHDSRFLYYVMDTKYDELRGLSDGGGGRGGLNLSIIRSVSVNMPVRDEQEKIADVLWDMDAEIDALVARREKAELVKQGMMQELLSGRVRLV